MTSKLSEHIWRLVCLIIFIPGLAVGQVVEYNGLLQVNGNKIVNQHNEVVSFAGNSFFWSNDNWGGERFYNSNMVEWLKQDWRSTIIRAAMGVEDPGGYLNNPQGNKDKLTTLVNAAIANDLYVIIDWHSHHAEDYQEEAIAFFEEMATTYGHLPNVLYEVYNEPLNVSWSQTVKPYAEAVIEAIRAIDPDNIIIVGSPEWSQKVDLVAADPITDFDNIAYTIHFYSIWHHKWLRDRATDALNSGIALFATEWGALGDTPDDPETAAWMQWCEDHQISHCNWAVNDKEEAWSIVKPGSSTTGNWSSTDLTISGSLVKQYIRNWPSTIELPTSAISAASNLTIFPNPSSSIVTVNLDNQAQVQSIKISDLNGRQYLLDNQTEGNSIFLDISVLNSGLYQIQIATDVGRYQSSLVKY